MDRNPHESRLERALRDGTLAAEAAGMRDGGLAQREVYEAFDAFRGRLRARADDAGEDAVRGVMDRIVGWCAPHQRLFDEPLTLD